MKKSFAVSLAVLGAIAVFVVSGCGDDDDDASTTATTTTTSTTPPPAETGAKGGNKGATKLDIAADKEALEFDTDKLDAKAGKVTVVMDNPSTIPHSVSIEGNGIDEEGTGGASGVGEGEKSTVSADLKPGTYTFYCPVAGHEQAGMKGTLTVQ